MYEIELRDINGNRCVYRFDSREKFYEFCVRLVDEGCSDSYDVMYVSMGGMLLYTYLCDGPLAWDDLIGYLA